MTAPPPKSRSRQRPCEHRCLVPVAESAAPTEESPMYAAPAHVAGLFGEAGYPAGRGGFGFRQWTVP